MKEEREEFCGACIAGVAALVGAGTAGATANDRKKNKNTQKIIFWIGVSITIISIIVGIYYLFFANCNDCK